MFLLCILNTFLIVQKSQRKRRHKSVPIFSSSSDSDSSSNVESICLSASECNSNANSIVTSQRNLEVASPRDTTNEVTANQESQIEEDLPPEVLDLLGVDKARQPQLTEAIHVSVARRWEKLLKSGMESDSIAELVKKYPPMTNCLVAAPQLNKQVCAVLSEQHKNRDIRLAELQNQLGASMSAIGRALSCLLNEGEDRNLPLIELLSDAGKLLANVHLKTLVPKKPCIDWG
ncbi:uncharacterized protein LOC115877975 [Sitophilus oryzae]|uniref:Uncharacterized protein LOC115877975 n=1 Tax=Sitophilus oryzae TaxID=7048 RepID=A0A6J2XGA6_SITOR|nr:uncharacterized protein LOC115877975 [Sitophilus oryzae]